MLNHPVKKPWQKETAGAGHPSRESLGAKAPRLASQAAVKEKVPECKMAAETGASLTTWESEWAIGGGKNYKVYVSLKDSHFMALE